MTCLHFLELLSNLACPVCCTLLVTVNFQSCYIVIGEMAKVPILMYQSGPGLWVLPASFGPYIIQTFWSSLLSLPLCIFSLPECLLSFSSLSPLSSSPWQLTWPPSLGVGLPDCSYLINLPLCTIIWLELAHFFGR